jgi:signal peptidase I
MASKKTDAVKKNFVQIFYAIIAALIIRSFLYEPFSIPSGSMYPNLKVGDYLFVSKFSYGFSKHSLPFSIPLIPGRIFYEEPERGDIIVFKTHEDNTTDYIKRLIGLPGDKIRLESNKIFINGIVIDRVFQKNEKYKFFDVQKIKENLPNNKNYNVYEFVKSPTILNTDNFNEVVVPKDSFFVLGDNRDNSQDSRYIGFIPKKNLVGRAEIVFVSFDTKIGSIFKFWTWYPALRKDRFFESLRPKISN